MGEAANTREGQAGPDPITLCLKTRSGSMKTPQQVLKDAKTDTGLKQQVDGRPLWLKHLQCSQ